MKKTIKVLQIFGSLNVGGAESRMMDVYRNIDTSKVSFDFLTMQEGKQYHECEILSLGGRIFKILPPRESGVLQNFVNIYNVIKQNGPFDAVHAHTAHHCGIALMAAMFAGVPVRIAHARTTGTKHTGLLSSFFIYLGQILITLAATHCLAISQKAADYLFLPIIVFKKYVLIIPNAIDIKTYLVNHVDSVDRLKKEFHIKPGIKVIGHVGRFESMKNQAFLVNVFIEMLKTNPDALLVFIGDGTLKNQIIKLVQTHNIQDKVLFLGIRRDVAIWMKVFDVVVMPSKFEGFCGVALEAQAAGTPCVLSDSIPVDVDMGLDIVRFLSLRQSIELWVKTILAQLTLATVDASDIYKQFSDRNFLLENSIEKICEIYGVGRCYRHENIRHYYNYL